MKRLILLIYCPDRKGIIASLQVLFMNEMEKLLTSINI